MGGDLDLILPRILHLAKGALTQANHHAVFLDPGNEHWASMSILNAAHAGELFIKAIIALEHPLLIFKDLFSLHDSTSEFLSIDKLLSQGRTYEFERLPQVLWTTTGIRIPNQTCYATMRRVRNAIQHFCVPETENLSGLALEFIYTIIDPLIAEYFSLFAIEYHEDHCIGYDYVVGEVMRRQLRFTFPPNFNVTEISIASEIQDTSEKYRAWVSSELKKIGRHDLLKGE